MAQDRFSVFPLTLVYDGPTTLNIQQINRVSVRSGGKKDTIIPGGAIDPAAIMLLGADPIVSIASEDVATLLTAISLTGGLECSAGNNLVQFQKRADGGTFQTGSNHVVLTNKKAFVYPKKLSVSQEKPAELELEMVCLFDGTSSGTPAVAVPPLVCATSTALTTTPAFNNRFYLGPVYVNSVQLPGVQDLDIDFGIEVQSKKSDGDVYPQICAIVARKPKLTAKFQKLDNVPSSLFNAALPGEAAFYLRQGAAGGARTSDASTAHIKISAATGAYSAEDMEAAGQEDASLTIPIDVTGTLSASLASTIP